MTISSFDVAFRFDGRLADEGKLDGSDHAMATSAARRLLALHAHCFLHGTVPNAAISDSEGYYHVQHAASRQGSHCDIWTVFVYPAALAALGVVGRAYGPEIKQSINAVSGFLRDGIRAASGRH